MTYARSNDEDAHDDLGARCALLDQYWEGLKRFSNSDPESWLGERPIEQSGIALDLKVLNLWNQANQAASAGGGKSTALSSIISLGPGSVSRSSTERDEEDYETPRQIGKYLVVAKLGEGGQARVFRVYNPEVGMERVVKLVKRTAAADPLGREKLKLEARTLAQCEHPNLVRVIDVDFDDARPFLVMEYVPGVSLEQFAQQHQPGPHESARIVGELAKAVSYLHGKGIIHQDIKPGNVIIDENGRPRLIDLGLARLRDAWSSDDTDWIGGTYSYMSPEQAQGRHDRIGPATDIFGLGGVLYYLLTGRPLYQGLTRESLRTQARKADYLRIRRIHPGVPRALERICQKALAANPEERYRTAAKLEGSLKRLPWPKWVAPTGILILALLAAAVVLTRSHPRASLVAPPRITLFDVDHFRHGEKFEWLGTIGRGTDEAICGDSLRVLVRFDAPVYCYLIALNPDGVIQPCLPEDESDKPKLRDEVGYPSGANDYFGLIDKDGPGLQAFVVVASREPLPAYAEWAPRSGWDWKRVVAGGVWWFDGRWIRSISSGHRGAVTSDADSPQAFRKLCDHLSKLPGIDMSQAIAFPVRERH
jgi:tRNA A-37 threonylcarbamoyl transferase component Bud32